MNQHQFFTTWATASDALPLVLTGSATAIKQALEFIQPLFQAADVYHLRPQKKTIPIADIRAMRQAASQSAWSGRRLVIISESEKLSPVSAQALLKILEDPTRSSRFMLTTQWYRRLLPTIRSRCLRVRLKSQTPDTQQDTRPAIASSLVERLARFSGEAPLDAQILEQITTALEQQLRVEGPTLTLRVAYQRLKEYYLIAAQPGGNQKLARDVLLSSLPRHRLRGADRPV